MQMGKVPLQGRSVELVVELVVVVLVVDVVGTLVVDVVLLHSPQQLPLSDVPPRDSQMIVERTMRQRGAPLGPISRHAARSTVPHVDRTAHCTTAHLHAAGSSFPTMSARAACDTHLTWLRCPTADSHGHTSAIWSATAQRACSQSGASPGLPSGPRARATKGLVTATAVVIRQTTAARRTRFELSMLPPRTLPRLTADS
jgi:hypothetical protein